MINIKEHILKYVLIAAISAAVITYGGYLKWESNRQKKERRNAQELLSQKDQVIQELKDDKGNLVQRILTDQATKQNLKIIADQHKAELDQMNVRINNLISLLKVSVQGKGTVAGNAETSYFIRDSVNNIYDTVRTWAFNDSLLVMQCGSVNDTIKCDYSIHFGLTAVEHNERFKFFVLRTWRKKNRKAWLDLKFSSPKLKADSIEFIRVKD